MTAGAKTKLQVDGVISIRLPSATNEPQATELTHRVVAWKTALIFNSPFEYDVIETFVRAHEELSCLRYICSRTRPPKLWDVNCGNGCI